MFKRCLNRYRLGKLAEHATMSLITNQGQTVFHMPFSVLLYHTEFLHGEVHAPDIEELYYEGSFKLVFELRGL